MKIAAASLALLAFTLISTSALAWGEEEEAAGSLIKASKSNSQKEREAALDRLFKHRPVAPREVDELREAIKSGDRAVREAALHSLANFPQDASSFKEKYLGLLDDADEDIQIVGIRAAREMKLSQAAPKVRKVLESRPRFNFKGRDPGGATAAHLIFSREAAETLADLGDDSAIDEILSRDEIMAVPSVAGAVVSKYGHKALPKVLTVARSRSERRKGAIAVIENMRDPMAASDLLQLTHDGDKEIACSAAWAISGIGKGLPNKTEVEARLGELREDKGELCVEAAYVGLLSIDSNRYLPNLMAALVKPDPQMGLIQLRVVYWLMQHPMPQAVPFLEKMIQADEEANPNDSGFRQEVARAIFKITGRKVSYKGLEKDLERHRKGIGSDPYDGH